MRSRVGHVERKRGRVRRLGVVCSFSFSFTCFSFTCFSFSSSSNSNNDNLSSVVDFALVCVYFSSFFRIPIRSRKKLEQTAHTTNTLDPTPQRQQHQQNQQQKPLAHKKLPEELHLYVRNLPFNITDEDRHDISGKYGAIGQIRIGQTRDTKGTAYVVYEDIYDAKAALEKLSGFNVANRYLIVLYFNLGKFAQKQLEKEEENLRRLQKKEGVSGEQTQK